MKFETTVSHPVDTISDIPEGERLGAVHFVRDLGYSVRKEVEALNDADAYRRYFPGVNEPVISRDILDVRAFGAKGDGSTNDSSAIQSALNEAAISSKTRAVYFPPGVYRCNITIPPQVILKGAGWSPDGVAQPGESVSVLKPASNASPIVLIAALRGQSLSDLDILGNGNGTSIAGVKVANGLNTYPGMGLNMRRVSINGLTTGIHLDSPNACTFEDVTAAYCGRGWHGVNLSDTWNLKNCHGDFCTIAAIEVESPRGVVIDGGDWGNQAAPLLIATGGGHVTWTNSNIESVSASRIFEVGNSSLSITGNRISGNGNASAALVRRTNYNGRDVIANNRCDGFSSYAETPYHLIWECSDSAAQWPTVEAQDGTMRVCTSSLFSADVVVDTVDRRSSDPNRVVVISDEFLGGGTSTGTIGDTGWHFYNWAGSGAVTQSYGGDNSGHPGVITISSGATTGNTIQLNHWAGLGSIAQSPFGGAFSPFEMIFVFAASQTANQIIHAGWMGGTVTAGVPADFVGIKHNPSESANFVAYAREGGVNGDTGSTGIAANTGFHTLRIRTFASGYARISIDGGTEVVLHSKVPAGAVMSAGVLIYTSENSAKSMLLDLWRWRLRNGRIPNF